MMTKRELLRALRERVPSICAHGLAELDRRQLHNLYDRLLGHTLPLLEGIHEPNTEQHQHDE